MMSAARFKQVMTSMNPPAQKVYEDVPCREAWTAKQIHAVANRTRNVSYDVVRACLDTLVRAGLVHESADGFQREDVKPAPVKKIGLADLKGAIQSAQPKSEEAPMNRSANIAAEVKPVEPGVDPAETVSRLAQALMAMSVRHQTEMRELADMLSDAAVEVQMQHERSEAGLVKLRQLQSLLKGIGE